MLQMRQQVMNGITDYSFEVNPCWSTVVLTNCNALSCRVIMRKSFSEQIYAVLDRTSLMDALLGLEGITWAVAMPADEETQLHIMQDLLWGLPSKPGDRTWGFPHGGRHSGGGEDLQADQQEAQA